MKTYISLASLGFIWFAGIYVLIISQVTNLLSTIA